MNRGLYLLAVCCSAIFITFSARAKDPVLETPIPAPEISNPSITSNGWFSFRIEDLTNAVYSVEAGTLTNGWSPIATLHGPQFWSPDLADFRSFIDPRPAQTRRFYRVTARDHTPDDHWKNQIDSVIEPFARSTDENSFSAPRWVKFVILTNEPYRVYFQDGFRFPFHYNFAVAQFPEFAGMTPEQFDAVTLHPGSNRAILGAVLFPADLTKEFAVQIIGAEPFPPDVIAETIELVGSAIFSVAPLKALYFPTFEQYQSAVQNRAFFASRKIDVANIDRWITENVGYSDGWGVGRLVFITAADINAAYLDGRLLPTDILLTDGIPAEIPYVAGVISLAPATPNSHVALLAQSHRIPFAYLASAVDRAFVQSLVGRQIAIGSSAQNTRAPYKVVDLTIHHPDVGASLLALKSVPQLEYSPKAAHPAYVIDLDTSTPADTRYVGGKAANFGTLRRSIPTNSPIARGITFRLWNEFMQQPSVGGQSLEQRIYSLLAPFTNYPPNMAQLELALTEVRRLITDTTFFTEAQKSGVESALAVFNSTRKIRFRSSTNVEDTESFLGAGLYDSYSGCLADDQDANTQGPSLCDPDEDKERGVYRAIRKVYASFYNSNAFLERLRRGVRENEVGMAILVHYSFPDPTELANGVATLEITRGPTLTINTKMVTQKGAVSVTNPEGDARPEVVEISHWGGTNFSQRSTLVPLGGSVLSFPDEYAAFDELFAKVAVEHVKLRTNSSMVLDLEYKKIAQPDGTFWLSVKQVREVPTFSALPTPAYVLAGPSEFAVFQGEAGDVFAIHRLKSSLQLSANFTRLSTNLTESFLGESRFAISNVLETNILTGRPSTWPQATFVSNPDFYSTSDSWTMPWRDGERRLTLAAEFFDPLIGDDELPIRFLDEAMLRLEASYPQPQPSIEYNGQTVMVTNEMVLLRRPVTDFTGAILKTRVSDTNAPVQIATSFYWPKPPTGFTAGYTAPLIKWVGTTISGLTAEPINLTGEYSQSYRPGHHNFSEEFVFEPQLDPNVSPATLNELRAKNVRMIYYQWNGEGEQQRINAVGFDNVVRPLFTEPAL